MDTLKNTILKDVETHLALATYEVSKVPAGLANPQLLDMTDLVKVQAQIAALGELKGDVLKVNEAVRALYERVGAFLDTGLMTDEELLELGVELGEARAAKLAEADKPEVAAEAEGGTSGAKYREAIRKEVGKTHSNVSSKGNNVFAHDDGRYYLGFFQKSASTESEMKFTVNAAIVEDLAANGPGHIYLVCKDGLVADIPVSELEDKDKPARWEFFVSIEDEEVTAVQGNKRAFSVAFDQFKVGVAGSAD